MKKIFRIIGLVSTAILALWPIIHVLAVVPDNIQEMTANPSDTSIVLNWIKVAGSDNTVIRYSTDTFPATVSSNYSAYNGTGSNTTVTGLVAGQAYFFAAWAYSSGNYSVTPYHLVMSTLAVAIPNGGADVPGGNLPTPTLPSMNDAPTAAGFDLRPFSDIITYFNTSPGGLGMPVNNVWETIAILGIVAGGFGTYVKIKNFFVAFGVLFLLTLFCIGLHLVQGWLLGVEIVIGAGVWGVEHYLQ